MGERAAQELKPNMIISVFARLKTVCFNKMDIETFIDVLGYEPILADAKKDKDIEINFIHSVLDPEELEEKDKCDPLRHLILPRATL